MPVHKVTKFLSEISTFFKKSDSETAMFAICRVKYADSTCKCKINK